MSDPNQLDFTSLSKAASHALRHEPWLYELELDTQGWVSVASLLEALSTERPEWSGLQEADLQQMIVASDKQRHEIADGKIRARYGHSVDGRVKLVIDTPPQVLFHGTSNASAQRIRSEGLRPMARQYVHLSANVEMARSVGLRKDKSPQILVVDAAAASADGITFYKANDLVWLADEVPSRHISVLTY